MTLRQIIGTALLGLGLNYCASMPLNYQGQPLTQTEQHRLVELKDKVDYLRSVSETEYDKAEQDILNARNADDFYEAKTRYNLFEILQIDEKDPDLHQKTLLDLTSLSLDLANRKEVERWTRGPHVPGRTMYTNGNFTSTCPGLERVNQLLQQKGINLGSYEYPFPVREASKILGELWSEKYRCEHK